MKRVAKRRRGHVAGPKFREILRHISNSLGYWKQFFRRIQKRKRKILPKEEEKVNLSLKKIFQSPRHTYFLRRP